MLVERAWLIDGSATAPFSTRQPTQRSSMGSSSALRVRARSDVLSTNMCGPSGDRATEQPRHSRMPAGALPLSGSLSDL
eukprot:4464501-Prymnesium_polylepis.1